MAVFVSLNPRQALNLESSTWDIRRRGVAEGRFFVVSNGGFWHHRSNFKHFFPGKDMFFVFRKRLGKEALFL